MTPRARRNVLRVAITLLGLVAVVVVWGWATAWRRLPYYDAPAVALPVPVMSDSAYGEVVETHARPYLVEIETPDGALLLYGATHTNDPGDPQIADIAARWRAFRPTVALCESRLGTLFPQLMNPVREFWEPGFVHKLARADGIPTYTWEPSRQVVMESLLALPFSKEQIALRVKLGPYFSNRRFGRPDDPKAFVNDYLGDNERWPGLERELASVEEIDEAWERYFPDGPDWRDVSDEFDLPGYLAAISTNRARDEHFVRVLLDLVANGERVFAVAGSSHAVKLDPALRAALDTR